MPLGRTTHASVGLVATATLCIASGSAATTLYVAPAGNDASPGSQAAPLKTFQAAVGRAKAADTIRLAPGTYDLAGFSATLPEALSIVGEAKDRPVLTNGETLTVSGAFSAKDLKFTAFRRTVILLAVAEGERIDGFAVDNCVFEKLHSAIATPKGNQGVITRVRITGCLDRKSVV